MKNVIAIKNLEKSYKGFKLDIPEMNIPKGFSTALIGANGAGKTTLIDIICGVISYHEGEITYFDDTTDIDSSDVKERIGYCAANGMFPINWLIKDIISAMSAAFDGFSTDRFLTLCKEFEIPDTFISKRKSIASLSDGNKMRVYLAAVLARDTNLLVLDEPGSSLDPLMRDGLCDKFREYLEKGDGENSIIFSTHNIADMENAADYAIIMNNGEIIEQGFIEQLKEKYIMVSADNSDTPGLAMTHMLTRNSTRQGITGLALSENRDKLTALGAITETPDLQQLSVELLKLAKHI